MADSNYYVDRNGDVWTSVVRDSAGNVVSAIEVSPDTGNAGTVPRIFIGNPGLTPIPATGSDSYFAWKQGEGSVGGISRAPSAEVKPTPSNSQYGVLPPAQTGLSAPIVAPVIDYSTPAQSPALPPVQNVEGTPAVSNVSGRITDANTRVIGQDATANVPVTEAPAVRTAEQAVTVGNNAVTIGMPGSAINANIDSNPALGNVNVLPDAAPVIVPSRANEFNPTTGSVEAGPLAQVSLAADGNLYITPDLATNAQLGTGVTQDANGRYVVSQGGVAVVPPNTEIKLEPGANITALPGTVGNTTTQSYSANNDQLSLAETAVPIDSAGAIVRGDQLEYAENAEIITDPLLENSGVTSPVSVDGQNAATQIPVSGTTPISPTQAGVDPASQLSFAEDAGTGFGISPEFVVGQTTPEISADSVTKQNNTSADGNVSIPGEFFPNIIPTENIFKKFSTMTYSVSVYALSAQRYAELISSGTKSVNGMTLILQSGGANSSTNPSENIGNFGAVRSKHFDVDFYIDDIELKGLVSGQSSQAAHNMFEIRFKILEPNGLSFLERLHAAVTEYMEREGAKPGHINYAAQNYLMVVRFYGYDEYGNPVSGSTLKKREPTSDPNAVTEKFIPFIFKGITFQLTDNLVEYTCEAAAPQSVLPFSDTHSHIPFNVELIGGTVKDILSGQIQDAGGAASVQLSESLERQGANVDPTKRLIFKGLTEALNAHQKRISGNAPDKKQTYPNEFVIEFEHESIADAEVLASGNTAKSNTGMPPTKDDPANQLDTNKNSVQKSSQIYTIPAGTSIIQAIEYVLKNSTYISSQTNVYVDRVTGEVKFNTDGKKNPFMWYKIRTKIVPIKYDNKTNDYAYRIHYVISRYNVTSLRTPYIGPPLYRGVHKQYDYWFTGQNTEILSFSQSYNYLYYQQALGVTGASESMPQTNTIHITKNYYMPRSNESALGGTGSKSGEIAANIASLLYSPADQANATVEILGDPDWMAQSEIFYSPDVALSDVGLGPFMTDGSINYDASEVLFGIKYNTAGDYRPDGLMDINYKPNTLRTDTPYSGGSLSLVYRANTITTVLSKGEFKQRLEGTLMTYLDDPNVERVSGGLRTGAQARIREDRRQANIIATAHDADISTSDISASLSGGKASSDGTPIKVQDPADYGMPEWSTDAEVLDMFDGDAEAAADFYNNDAEPAQEISTAVVETPPVYAQNNTSPVLSDNPEPQTQTELPPKYNDIPAEQANTAFTLPTVPKSGPGWTEPETLQRIPEGVTPDPLTEGTDQMYYYKGKNISGRTQAELDAQVQAIDSGQPISYDAYDPYLNQRIRVNYDPVTDTTAEEGYYDEKTGKFIKG